MATTVLNQSQSLDSLGVVMAQAVNQVKFVINRARSRRHVAQLDSRLLADIGLTREDAMSESRKVFWQA